MSLLLLPGVAVGCADPEFKPKAVSAVTNADLARTIGDGLSVRGSVFSADDGACAGARAVQLFGSDRLRDLGVRRGGTQGGVGVLALKWTNAERSKLNAAIVDCSDAKKAARKLIAASAGAVGAATTKPATTKPVTTKPATTKPATTRPATTKPATTKPATTKPGTTKPVSTSSTAPTPPVTISKSVIGCVADQVTANPVTAEQVLIAALGSDQESMDRLIADRASKCLSSGVVEVVVPARGVVPAGSTDVLAEVNE